jgi:hypothetical protein
MHWILLLSLASGQHVKVDDIASEAACLALGRQLGSLVIVSADIAEGYRRGELRSANLSAMGPTGRVQQDVPARAECVRVK